MFSRSSQNKASHMHISAHYLIIASPDDDCCASVQPSFKQWQAEEHFSEVYSATPRTFTHPEWMPDCPPPSIPMSTCTALFTETFVLGVQHDQSPIASTTHVCIVNTRQHADELGGFVRIGKSTLVWTGVVHLQ